MTTYSETKMYGMTEQQIRDQYMNGLTAKLSGLEMVAMGILSDCQELLHGLTTADARDARGQEMIRKQLNVAKFILCEMMDEKSTQHA